MTAKQIFLSSMPHRSIPKLLQKPKYANDQVHVYEDYICIYLHEFNVGNGEWIEVAKE